MKLKPIIVSVLALILATASPAAWSAIKPGSLFTDNAVLQQQMPVPVWGTADPGELVTVSIAGQKTTATTGSAGDWSLKLNPIAAGGPYTMTISGTPGDLVTLNNLLVGEVWVCSGQSNMEFGIRLAADGEKAIEAAGNPNIRLFNAGRDAAIKPRHSVASSWEVCTPDALRKGGVWGGFSAVAYYFGRDIQRDRNVPVGLIQACRGGTMAALWTSREGLSAVPSLKYYVDQFDQAVATYGDKLNPDTATADDLKKLYTDARAKYDADNAPIVVKFNADTDAAKAKYQADVAAAQAAGQPIPPQPRWATHPKLPPPQFDFGSVANATELFNGVIDPLIPYAIRGVIWYQGESNGGGDGSYPARSFEYKTLFPTLIADWRSHWNEGDFPFYFAQLAPNEPPAPRPTPNGWAEVREAQRLTAQAVPNTGMAVITDIGDPKNVHPKRKEAVGDRLALIARANVYKESVEYSGPQFDSVKFTGGTATITFNHADGMHAGNVTGADGAQLATADKLVGFMLAGADQKYYPADAAIAGSVVTVTSPDVTSPVAVRYGYVNNPVANLQNGVGLWASPFKTDDWPWLSRNNHG